MTREEIHSLAIKEVQSHRCIIFELVTGFGKSKASIDLANYIKKDSFANILILVDKNVHKSNWDDEITKWGGFNNANVVKECYASLKNYRNTVWDIIICDEIHHLNTEARLEVFRTMSFKYMIGLSATISKGFKFYLSGIYKAAFITCDLQEAIDEGVLPEPIIYKVPLVFDNEISEVIVKNPKEKDIVKCDYYHKNIYFSVRNKRVEIACTKRQYYNDITSLIDYYKRKHREMLYLKMCGDRLKWLSEIKEEYCKELLRALKDNRTLTFCSSIKQTENLGKYCINSKNKKAIESLDKFNSKKIKHITACQMLNEGMNLKDCQIGIYCNINASERINKQKAGRLLRHKKPIIIIPYWVNTREEEIVNKMLQEYDSSYIFEVSKEELINRLKK